MSLDRHEALLDAIMDAALEGDGGAVVRLGRRLMQECGGDLDVTFAAWVAVDADGWTKLRRVMDKASALRSLTMTPELITQAQRGTAHAQ